MGLGALTSTFLLPDLFAGSYHSMTFCSLGETFYSLQSLGLTAFDVPMTPKAPLGPQNMGTDCCRPCSTAWSSLMFANFCYDGLWLSKLMNDF